MGHWISPLPLRCRCVTAPAQAPAQAPARLTEQPTGPLLLQLSYIGVFFGGRDVEDHSENDALGSLTVNKTLKI